MSLQKLDLNLLIYFDALLKTRNVTHAANRLGISQPAMSYALKRLREQIKDPILIRSTKGMVPTERALSLENDVQMIIARAGKIFEPMQEFDPKNSRRVFRIMASDYAEATLIPHFVKHIDEHAPGVIIDLLTPSDVSYKEVESGRVDVAINRFSQLPQAFHQNTLWRDNFSCLLSKNSKLIKGLDFESYLKARHIWVSKIGMGVGFGVNPEKKEGLGWIDNTLHAMGKKRDISVFTRHYLVPALLLERTDLIATLPTRLAEIQAKKFELNLVPPPFDIPNFELKIAWSPLLHHNPAHQWLRRTLVKIAVSLGHQS